MNTITTYATIEDLESRYRTLTTEERAKAQVLLEDVSVKIRQEFKRHHKDIPTDEDGIYSLKIVSCSVVKRVMSSPGFDDNIGADIKEYRTDVGILSETYGFSNPDGSMYFTKDELKMLGLYRDGAITTIPYLDCEENESI